MRPLGRDQSQNYKLILRHFAERLKGAGAGIVVFQQQSLRVQLAEQLAADRFITSLGQPPAALIAPSDMESESHVGKSSHDGIVEFYADRKPPVETPAEVFVKNSRPRV